MAAKRVTGPRGIRVDGGVSPARDIGNRVHNHAINQENEEETESLLGNNTQSKRAVGSKDVLLKCHFCCAKGYSNHIHTCCVCGANGCKSCVFAGRMFKRFSGWKCSQCVGVPSKKKPSGITKILKI